LRHRFRRGLEIANVNQVFQPEGRLRRQIRHSPSRPENAWLSPIGKYIQLWANAENARTEAAEHAGLAEVVGDLLVGRSRQSRRTPASTGNATRPSRNGNRYALVLRVRILEIVGEAATPENSSPVTGFK